MNNMNGREYPKDFEWDAWEHYYEDENNKEPKIKKMKKEKEYSAPKKRVRRNK